jgi:hypothetical protein
MAWTLQARQHTARASSAATLGSSYQRSPKPSPSCIERSRLASSWHTYTLPLESDTTTTTGGSRRSCVHVATDGQCEADSLNTTFNTAPTTGSLPEPLTHHQPLQEAVAVATSRSTVAGLAPRLHQLPEESGRGLVLAPATEPQRSQDTPVVDPRGQLPT